jgi:hypothetical protein
VGLLVLFCWSLWGIFFVRPFSDLVRVRRWVPETCEILASGVARREGTGLDSRFGRRSSPSTFEIDVTYQWRRGGEVFTGNRYDFYGWRNIFAEGDWTALAASLRPGARVGCFVDPRDPREAVIEREIHGAQLVAWALAWGAFVFGAAALRGAVRERRQVGGRGLQ